MLYPSYSKDFLFSAILCGEVWVDGVLERDHTKCVKKGSSVQVIPQQKRYVSRGGDKLAPVLDAIAVPVAKQIWLDCGASTGGFTQCLLSRGAMLVHAVDVGYNILDYSLRTHPRVQVHERTNIMGVSTLDPMPNAALADLSFRSLRKVSAHILSLCTSGYLLALCKPQFEYGMYAQQNMLQAFGKETKMNEAIAEEFTGVLADKEVITEVLFLLCCNLLQEGVMVSNIVPAGIKGRQGNQEYFLEMHSLRHPSLKVQSPIKKQNKTTIPISASIAEKISCNKRTITFEQAEEYFSTLLLKTI